MTVFLILYECTWSSSIMSLLDFLFELVLPENEGESVRGGKGKKTLPPEKGRTAPMYFEGLKLWGNICLTPAQPAELRGEGNSRQRQIKI